MIVRVILFWAVIAAFRILHRLTISSELQRERLKAQVDWYWFGLGLPCLAVCFFVCLLDFHPVGPWGFIPLIAGGLLNWWATATNPYFVPSIRVVEGQRPIVNGPYAAMRHPGYAGFLAMILSFPLCMGAMGGFIPLIGVLWFFIRRIQREEGYLRRNLVGYEEYTRLVRWKLIPGVW